MSDLRCFLLIILGAIAGNGEFSIFDQPTYMREVNCNGSEESLFNCQYSNNNRHSCPSQNLAGVICQGIVLYNINSTTNYVSTCRLYIYGRDQQCEKLIY